MKIGIDTFGCDHGRSGLGSYLLNFISNLSDVKDFELFGSEIDRYTYSSDSKISYKSVKVKETFKSEQKWHIKKSQKFCKKNNYDYVIYPAAEKYLPLKFKVPSLAIMNSSLSSVYENSDYNKVFVKKIKKGLMKVNKIAAGSNYIREDLISWGVPENKIKVIFNGVDHKLFFPPLEMNDDYVDVKPFSIKRPYFLYNTRLSSSGKNHECLIDAFCKFKKMTGYPHRLVIAGSEGAFSDKIQKAVFDCDYASDILLTGYFPHESLPMLYAGATACVFPAKKEGVGLPIVEAMSCGIPVLCSSSGALSEIGGNVPLYFDSDNSDEIAEKMKVIIDNVDIAKKKVSEGLEHAANFNWSSTVSQTINYLFE